MDSIAQDFSFVSEELLSQKIETEKETEVSITKEDYLIAREKLQNDDIEQTIDLRKKFSWAIYGFVVAFVFTALIILIMCAAGCVDFHLSDTVLITLLTTMTTTIVGLLIFVVKYFFPESK